MFEALSNRDSIQLKSYCTPDITLYEYGQVWNLDTLIRKAIVMNTSPDFKRTNSFEFINTELNKTKAWVTYRLNSVIYNNGKESTVQWLETVVLSKQNGQWKVKHLHSTLLKRTQDEQPIQDLDGKDVRDAQDKQKSRTLMERIFGCTG